MCAGLTMYWQASATPRVDEDDLALDEAPPGQQGEGPLAVCGERDARAPERERRLGAATLGADPTDRDEVVVARDREGGRPREQAHAHVGVRVVPDDIPEAEQVLHPPLREERLHGREGLEVTVNVRDDPVEHGAPPFV